MKYTVHDSDLNEYIFSTDAGHVTFEIPNFFGGGMVFTEDQFKDFRKAVGYVWQEVHSDGE